MFPKLIVLVALTGATACAAPSPNIRDPGQLVFVGERLADRLCAECHAIGAEGDSALAEAPPFRQLRSDYSRGRMERLLQQRMVEVHPRMPVLTLEPDELAAFLDYWSGLKAAAR